MSNYEISKSSLLSLKAEILRKQQELVKAKADNEVKIKIIKKNAPLEIKNKGIEARQKNDLTEEDEDLLRKSKSVLEAKSKLYDRLSSGKLTAEESERKKRFLVRFDKKNKSVNRVPSPIDFEDSEPDQYPESDEECYNSDENNSNKDPGEKWVDYTDCLGRTRKCLQKDLEYLMSKDKELKISVEAKKRNKSEHDRDSDSCLEKDKDEKLIESSEKVDNKESELLSSDMRRELLRQQWEKEEEILRNKSDIHYQDILFGEARTHGVGYYGFSKDEEERAKQQEALKLLRDETELKQKRAQELKAIREKQLAARIKAAKDRRRVRLGLPPEEEETPAVAVPEIPEDKIKEDELKKKKEERERLLEEARRKHVRPWDLGKEGVKEHYEMTHEEWVDKKRDERPAEYAPPQSYKPRNFRSEVAISSPGDADKSLQFTTKKSRRKNRNKINGSSCIERSEFENSNILNSTEDIVDHATFNYKEHNMEDNKEETSTRKGVEIPPPPTFDYYGPGNTKKPKYTQCDENIESSIEAGLKFLRKLAEEKEKSSRQYNDYTLPY